MESWLIGSAPESDIVVDQPMVSGRHCRLTRTSDGFLLEDLGSTNGTFVNSERITDSRNVSSTDTITLGTKAKLPWPADAEATPVASGSVPASALNRKYVIAGVLGVAALLAVIGVAAMMSRKKPADPPEDNSVEVAEKEEPGEPETLLPITEDEIAEALKEGFQMGTFEPNDVIETIKVTLFVGDDGDDLEEPVDLHLGLGFPLRLYPVGSEERNPSFAAFPQTTSIRPGETSVLAGTSAWFRFLAKQPPDQGQDVLRTTPPLLTDVRYADIQRIGFACQGESGWVLEGYEIEINGKLFASHGSVDRNAADQQLEFDRELKELLSEAEPLALQVLEGEAYAEAGLANDTDKAELAQAKQELAELEDPINLLRGQVEGYYPWYLEDNPAFKPTKPQGGPIRTVQVSLLAGGDENSGSKNAMYLKARGRKYLLSSAIDPLRNDPELQKFTISPDVLNFDPVTSADLHPSEIGIGMLGNDDPFDRIPDRANVQRVILEVDGQQTYDSEKNAQDRSTLAAVSFIPPVHRDNVGFPVENPTSPYQIYLWKPGMPLPEEKKTDLTPEPDQGEDDNDEKKKKGLAKNGDTKKDDDKKKKLPGLSGGPGGPGGQSPGRGQKQGPPNSRRRPSFPVVIINFPPGGGSGGAGSRGGGGTPGTPGPTKPVISDVRIEPGNNPVRIGQPVRVTWKVKGNKVRINKFRVRLYPVLPHQAGKIIKPVANTTSTTSGSRRVNVQPTQALLNASGVAPAQQPYLFVEPEVTALSVGGKLINGTAARGPILPLFAAGPRAPIRLSRAGPSGLGITWNVLPGGQPSPGFPVNTTSSPFAVFNGIGWPFNRPITPGDRGAASSVWRLNSIEVSQGHEFDAYPFHANGRWAHNTAARSANAASLLCTQYVVINVPAPQRLVAHVGFVGGFPTRPNTGLVRVEVRVVNPAGTRVLRWIGTNTNITCSKSRKTWTLIDIPIAGVGRAGQHNFGNGFAPPGTTSGSAVPMDFLYLPPPIAQPDYLNLARGTNSIVAVSIFTSQTNFWLNTARGKRDAVGVFGLRLIP